ncbi:LytTR family DNA-binding domain-containing protein [uncultured Tateyamaria sp.]|uniref:LytTR family DNA-binding domain-containing protein n=1 Tax=uncultured Tateyamaria sp. TaxID=455651 RepID=UPI0026022CBB|nr:LytTR family DNA-binding domain-containing protein [uncultured Tateyamaria sp.]
MNDGQPQFALREWRTHMAHPVTLTALIGVGLILGLAGPFGTDTRLRFAPRVLYWLVTVALTYGVGAFCDLALRGLLSKRQVWLRVLITAAVSGIGVALVVAAINFVAFGWIPTLESLPGFLGPVIAIAAIVTAVLTMIRQQNAPQVAPQTALAPAQILKRLPIDKRGPLVALSVEDHYVRIQTTKGEALVLMRLSDAINEVGDTLGAQVHRSHWAAFDQVRAATRLGDRATLTMTNGNDIPVSRANVPTVKEAGLLP